MIRTISIGKKKYVAGMTWATFDEVPTKNAIKNEAILHNSAWITIRKNEELFQIGLCPAVDNKNSYKSMCSLGDSVSNSLLSPAWPWRGVFQLSPDLWWYIAVRDDNCILPDGDFLGTRNEVALRETEHEKYGNWKNVEGDLRNIEEYVNQSKIKSSSIYPVGGEGKKNKSILISILLILTVATVGIYWWSIEKKREEEIIAAIERRKIAQSLIEEKKPIQVPSELLTLPSNTGWQKACKDIIYDLDMSKDGWELSQVACEAEYVSVLWVKQGGATVSHRPPGQISPEGNAVEQRISLPSFDRNSIDDAISLVEAKTIMRGWAQSAGFNITLTDVPAPPILPGADQSNAPKLEPKANVAMDIAISALDLDTSNLPGFRIKRIVSTELGWHIDGTLYGK